MTETKYLSNALIEYEKDYKKQRKAHPSLPTWVIRRIASDDVRGKRK